MLCNLDTFRNKMKAGISLEAPSCIVLPGGWAIYEFIFFRYDLKRNKTLRYSALLLYSYASVQIVFSILVIYDAD